MAFTDMEMAVLSQLAYYDVPFTPEAGKTLADFISMGSVTNYLFEKMGEGYYDTIISLARTGKEYTIVAASNDRYGSGFAAFAIADSNNEVTVACRGTELPSLGGYLSGLEDSLRERIIKAYEAGDYNLLDEILDSVDDAVRSQVNDFITDLQIGFLKETNQQAKMEEFVRGLEAKGYSGYYFTGHSLGGNLAMHGAIILRDPSKVKGVTVYNAPGFNQKYYAAHGMKIARIEKKIVCYQNEKDWISSLFDSPGKIIIVQTKGSNHHSFIGFETYRECFVLGSVKSAVPFVSNILTETVDQGWYMVMFFEYSMGGRRAEKTICRDFSEQAKDVFVGAAKEVEEEKWWDITKWDAWYRVQDCTYGLEWDLYSGQVNKYYRKLIDVNEASVKDIENIFEKVYGIDDAYTTKIGDLIDRIKVGVTTEAINIHESIQPTT